MPSIITLLTDFGWQDPYVAAMKGVILSVNPRALIHDLGHQIPAQDIRSASHFLSAAVPCFPQRTIHTIVVDPGVGTMRRAVAARIAGQFFICPDNGILSGLLEQFPLEEACEIKNRDFMRHAIVPTFHGRDIFAQAAALLSLGARLKDTGPLVKDLIRIPLEKPQRAPDRVSGIIERFDIFGNALTNIAVEDLKDNLCTVLVQGNRIPCLSTTYADVPEGQVLALPGSSGRLEIAVNQGSARSQLYLKEGDAVEVLFMQPEKHED